jgi:hypothetical protein
MIRRAAWRLVTKVASAFLVPIAIAAAAETPGDASSGGVVGFLNGSLMTSGVTGDVPFPIGLGGEGAFGVRIGATTIRLVGGGTSHHLKNGEVLVLGDSLTVASDWSITWLGVDQQYYLRDDRPGGPFLSAGVAFAYLTHGEKDNVSGWRLAIGAGHEIAIHRMVSLQLAAEVDYVHAGSAKAAGKKIRLEEAFDEVAFSVRCGFTIYDLTRR